MFPDLINACFETLAGLFVLNHCRVLYRDKTVRGVSVVSCIFFLLWGGWNLYYYPAIGQLWSFAGGVFVVVANGIYVAMLWYYASNELGLGSNDEQEMHLRFDMLGDKR